MLTHSTFPGISRCNRFDVRNADTGGIPKSVIAVEGQVYAIYLKGTNRKNTEEGRKREVKQKRKESFRYGQPQSITVHVML